MPDLRGDEEGILVETVRGKLVADPIPLGGDPDQPSTTEALAALAELEAILGRMKNEIDRLGQLVAIYRPEYEDA